MKEKNETRKYITGIENLSDADCRNAKPKWDEKKQKFVVNKLADGGGLYLLAQPIDPAPEGGKAGDPGVRKSWVFIFTDRVNRKRPNMGLGRYGKDYTSLAKARVLAGEARALIADLKNPIDERNRKLKEAQAAQAKLWTFKQCAEAYIDANKAQWKNPKHTAQWTSTLTTYAAPIWTMLVRDIDQEEVLSCIEPHWKSKTETMTRVRQRIEAVLAWAKVKKYRTGDNPAAWKNHLDKVLPKPSKLKNVQNRAAISYHDIGGLMAKLRAKDSMAARALELQILTATRPGEVCSAQWDEFQLNNATITVVGKDKQVKLIPVPGLWTIPGEKMKAGKEHTIPLSEQAVSLLKAMPRLEGTDYVFPGLRPSKPMSTAAGMKLLKGTKNKDGSVKVKGIRPGITAHGMRSTFRDWAGESTAHAREVIEKAMAHQLKDKAEAAYARGNQIDKRRQLMRDWAKYCDVVQTQQASNVTPIGKQA